MPVSCLLLAGALGVNAAPSGTGNSTDTVSLMTEVLLGGFEADGWAGCVITSPHSCCTMFVESASDSPDPIYPDLPSLEVGRRA